MTASRVLLPAGALGLAVAASLLTEPNQLNHYDQYWALIWGRELAGGDLPDYVSTRASTPHPLTVLVTAPLSFAGDELARELLGFLNLLAWAVIVLAAGAIGWRLVNPVAAVLGAIVVAGAAQFFDLVGSGSADAAFAALLMCAVAVEVRRPRAGLPVLVLLAVAGLTRPEAWLFAGAYWLWLFPRSTTRLRDGVIVVAAPVTWMLADAVVTGDPLFSLTRTQAGARGFRPTGPGEVLPQTRAAVTLLLDAPEILGAAACAALLLWRRAGAALVPAAVVVLSFVGFAALGVVEVPMLPRYLLVAAALISAAAGWALAGWRELSPRPARLVFAGLAVVTLVLFATRVPGRVDTWRALQDDQRYRAVLLDDLRSVVRGLPASRCDIWVSHEFKAAAAYERELPPDRVRSIADERPVGGLMLVPATARGLREYKVPPRVFATALAGAPTVAAGERWKVVDAGCRP